VELILDVPLTVRAAPDGVYCGLSVCSVEDWIRRYLETGLHQRDWDGLRVRGALEIAWWLRTLAESAEYGSAEPIPLTEEEAYGENA